MLRRRSLLLTTLSAPAILPSSLLRANEQDPVDMLLVLAVDVSRSIDEDEARLQREGYRSAVCDPQVVSAIRRGMIGAIGIAYVEWAGFEYQRLVIPWTRIGSQGEADAWSSTLQAASRVSLSWTSISGAIDFSRRTLAEAPFEATRRVIDVSGDGVNNSGRPVGQASGEAVADGITINGLPILEQRTTYGATPQVPLDEHYREHVIGGPGAFVMVANGFESFGQAVRRKIIREVAGSSGPPTEDVYA